MATHGASHIYYSLLVCPSEAMAAVRRGDQRGLAVTVVGAALVSVMTAWAVLWGPCRDPLMGAALFVMGLCLLAALVSCLWTALTLMCHGLARTFGGYGRVGSCWTALGLATAPAMLAAPLAVLMINAGSRGMYTFAVAMVPLLVMWCLALAVTGLVQIYRLSPLEAVATVIFPPMLLLGGGWTLTFLGLSYTATVFGGIYRMLAGVA